MTGVNKNIAIDLGNTIAKIGIFEEGKLVNRQVGVPFDLLAQKVNELNPNHVVISSVNQNVKNLVEKISASTLILNHTTLIPIDNKYSTPETLGKDRLAAVIGAFTLKAETNTLVIDVGTCITYDFINAKNEYQGGGISPGVDLKFKALHNFTANLPLIEVQQEVELVGDTTEKAILSGVINGTIAEIEEIIRMYRDKFSHLRIIMCGGGASELHSKLKIETELAPDLVLIGLNRILEHNV